MAVRRERIRADAGACAALPVPMLPARESDWRGVRVAEAN